MCGFIITETLKILVVSVEVYIKVNGLEMTVAFIVSSSLFPDVLPAYFDLCNF